MFEELERIAANASLSSRRVLAGRVVDG